MGHDLRKYLLRLPTYPQKIDTCLCHPPTMNFVTKQKLIVAVALAILTLCVSNVDAGDAATVVATKLHSAADGAPWWAIVIVIVVVLGVLACAGGSPGRNAVIINGGRG